MKKKIPKPLMGEGRLLWLGSSSSKKGEFRNALKNKTKKELIIMREEWNNSDKQKIFI